uniref:Uncharacterized protein n=1 Tax=Hemiselmis tepida TaxID=464990 RepID=A0A7S0YVF8_9CRYP|mmetsp:Transcript_24934/g.63251  ORF Transcript_24934/g.63251 Transcript_24934/m.63251 type:complete len:253 (+) Transcript_24934:63-821(+)
MPSTPKFLSLALLGLLLLSSTCQAASHGGDEDGHDHDHAEGTYEWVGTFELPKGDHTLTFKKVDGKYADPSILMSFMRLEAGAKFDDDLHKEQKEPFAHALEKTTEAVKDACVAAKKEMGTEDCPMHLEDGDKIDLSELEVHSHEGHDHGRRDSHAGEKESMFVLLEMMDSKAETKFTLSIADTGTYAMITQHMMTEFGENYLTAAGGANVKPTDVSFPPVEVKTTSSSSSTRPLGLGMVLVSLLAIMGYLV